MGNNNDTLKQIQNIIGEGNSQAPDNIFSLFQNKDTPFKDQLIQVFVSLNHSQALQIYNLFSSLPDVKEAWTRALEKRIEKQQVDIENMNLQIQTLDKDLNELLEKYTELHGRHSEYQITLEGIVRKQKEIQFSDEDISTDAEAELLGANQEIIDLAQKALRPCNTEDLD